MMSLWRVEIQHPLSWVVLIWDQSTLTKVCMIAAAMRSSDGPCGSHYDVKDSPTIKPLIETRQLVGHIIFVSLQCNKLCARGEWWPQIFRRRQINISGDEGGSLGGGGGGRGLGWMLTGQTCQEWRWHLCRHAQARTHTDVHTHAHTGRKRVIDTYTMQRQNAKATDAKSATESFYSSVK